MNLLTTTSNLTNAKGKLNIGDDIVMTNPTSPSSKNTKLFNDAFLQVVEYPTPTMVTTKGEEVETEKALLEQYGSLKL